MGGTWKVSICASRTQLGPPQSRLSGRASSNLVLPPRCQQSPSIPQDRYMPQHKSPALPQKSDGCRHRTLRSQAFLLTCRCGEVQRVCSDPLLKPRLSLPTHPLLCWRMVGTVSEKDAEERKGSPATSISSYFTCPMAKN